MIHTSKAQTARMPWIVRMGACLSLLAALACSLQPGGRKARFAGPCGKELCTCPLTVTVKPKVAALPVECAAKTPPLHHFCEFSTAECQRVPVCGVWHFDLTGSPGVGTVMFEFAVFSAPETLAPLTLDQEENAGRISEVVSRYNEPSPHAVYPPPKSLVA